MRADMARAAFLFCFFFFLGATACGCAAADLHVYALHHDPRECRWHALHRRSATRACRRTRWPCAGRTCARGRAARGGQPRRHGLRCQRRQRERRDRHLRVALYDRVHGCFRGGRQASATAFARRWRLLRSACWLCLLVFGWRRRPPLQMES